MGEQAGVSVGADPQGCGHTGRDFVGLSFQRGCRGTARIGVGLDLGFVCGDPKQLLMRALWAGTWGDSHTPWPAPPALGLWLHADSMNTVSCQSVGFQGYMSQGGFGAGFEDLECQAQLTAGLAMATQSWDPRAPMWHTCQYPAPAENAHPPLPPWNLLPAAPASAASPDPAAPTPTWSWK